ncbi:MAG: cytochrome c oxidase, cbb3-type, subunit [Caulobacteraceae bacterium]|nr:cytochrome c oxidase, cbb3-type, subunit [Caulobacteraceae bacterium]
MGKLFTWNRHGVLERNSIFLLIGIIIVVAIGGIIEITPLFYINNTIEPVAGIRPYTPLELAGRDIYVREGCYGCHSQMIRPLRDEVERYGHYSLAAESMYDHPFQWGSKRTGPDLARVGAKYSDIWQVDHLTDPRALVPESVMPPYKFLSANDLNLRDLQARVKTMKILGVPYTQAMVDDAVQDAQDQADPTAADTGLQQRYGGKINHRDFDGDPEKLSEMDALVAYLQMLGTEVDFSTYQASAPGNQR